ncbi:Hypothetical_protein [Hexamita inflata]|uniref:Hypothetical_protein n=1 Tax=Hexamita inflata TaxID=28002 RepID=A0AA86N8Y2_9EUKA|nr:Hypothetical protein HINF_LOCUS2660 [Hexamita inflata]
MLGCSQKVCITLQSYLGVICLIVGILSIVHGVLSNQNEFLICGVVVTICALINLMVAFNTCVKTKSFWKVIAPCCLKTKGAQGTYFSVESKDTVDQQLLM